MVSEGGVLTPSHSDKKQSEINSEVYQELLLSSFDFLVSLEKRYDRIREFVCKPLKLVETSNKCKSNANNYQVDIKTI